MWILYDPGYHNNRGSKVSNPDTSDKQSNRCFFIHRLVDWKVQSPKKKLKSDVNIIASDDFAANLFQIQSM